VRGIGGMTGAAERREQGALTQYRLHPEPGASTVARPDLLHRARREVPRNLARAARHD
jgi:hypothetical protein